ncbi:transposase [Ktedonobacter sp. SOSP1-85]|uniref:helix-turn-helix domain-containing protein n=1 Tax=Ktedonobacter sp. SOSP1-85 TaxID=2778367 RepID=UPI001A2E4C4C|nr:helix-turn-helix domain-containing protein [Ktedonobacter sp. SOSP1-85]GHO79309.1 transposase [Ktedonobacter sp. SOSP1-85]
MKAYSNDLRERVVHAVEEGRPREEIVHLFGVSRATVKRYAKQYRETGDLAPQAIPGRPAVKGASLRSGLWSQLEANRDATLEEHRRIWEATHGQQVSAATMGRAIKKLGWTRKKRRWWPPNRTRRHEPPGESTLDRTSGRTGYLSMNVERTLL